MLAYNNAPTPLPTPSTRQLQHHALSRCPGSIVKAHTFDVTSCARGLGVRHSILTPVGGSEFEFQERCELERDLLPALTLPALFQRNAGGLGVRADAAHGGVDGVLY